VYAQASRDGTGEDAAQSDWRGTPVSPFSTVP